jgi:acylphosphatase
MKAFLVTLGLTLALAYPVWPAEEFTGTKELRLIHGDLGSPKAKTVVITDKAKIAKLVATIKLEKKEPCACDHIDHAVFVKDKGEITVSLCDHCFDIGMDTYQMPPEFYKLYMAYTQEVSATAKPPGPPVKSDMQRREVYFSGRVQGVGFRYSTSTLARQFAVTGFVKNLPDGRVQLIVEGRKKEIESFLAAIRKERSDNITKTEETTKPATAEFKGFEIRY